MGVRHLLPYMDACCKESIIKIRLDQEAKVFTDKTAKCPVIVVDGHAILKKLYPTDISWIFGGQWREYMQRLNSFLSSFNKCGIELVFIFDGVIDIQKRDEWFLNERNSKKEIANIFKTIKTKAVEPDSALYRQPSGLATFTMFALKSLGATVLASIINVQKEIANYCHRHSCFGIMSDDLDFVIFQTGYIFSINHLDIDRRRNFISTVAYSRGALCTELSIDVNNLPLLATLLGNDIVPTSVLSQFHASLLRRTPHSEMDEQSYLSLIPAIAQFINSSPPGSDILRRVSEANSKVLFESVNYYSINDDGGMADEDICPVKVLKPGSGGRFTRLDAPVMDNAHTNENINNGSLVLCHTPPSRVGARVDRSVFQLAKRRHVRVDNTVTLYNILTTAAVRCDATLEDATNGELSSHVSLFRSLRQRLYGLLYGITSVSCSNSGSVPSKKMRLLTNNSSSQDENQSPPLVIGQTAVEEWFVCSEYDGSTLLPALPLPGPGGTPKLETLWLTENVSDLRLRTFLEIMNCEEFLEDDLLSNPKMLIFYCVLHYMMKQPPNTLINGCEVDAFVAQAACLCLHDVHSLKSIQLNRVDPRAVQLAFLFIRGVQAACDVNCAVGWVMPVICGMPWHFFDGRLFHLKFLQAESGAHEEVLCESRPKVIEEFRRMKALVTKGTRFQSA